MKAIELFANSRTSKVNKADLLNFVYFLRDNNFIQQNQVDKMWGENEK